MMKQGILVVLPDNNLSSHPTMVQVVRALSELWSFVHVMSPGGDIRVRRGQDPTLMTPMIERMSANPYLAGGRFRALERRCASALLTARRRDYAAVIGVDPEGIVWARELNRRLRKPLVYASFELLFRNEIHSEWEKTLKANEIEASHEVVLALVQDELRELLLRENCDFGNTIFCHCPVAPMPATTKKSNFLRANLGIPSEKRIVLLAGYLLAFCSRDLLYEMVSSWKDPYHLVVHSRFDLTPRERIFLEQLSSSTGRVSVTRSSVSLENLTDIFGSADFALLPYCPEPTHWTTLQNVYHIGMSSGKAAYAAMCGLPMVASSLPTYKTLFTQIKCGEVYSHVNEIPSLLAALDDNYDFHSSEARRCYDERMNPVKGITSFCHELARVACTASV